LAQRRFLDAAESLHERAHPKSLCSAVAKRPDHLDDILYLDHLYVKRITRCGGESPRGPPGPAAPRPGHSVAPEPFRPLARSLLRNHAGAATMAKPRILPVFLAFLLALCLATSADARRWRWWHYGGYDRADRAERSGDDSSRLAGAGEFP